MASEPEICDLVLKGGRVMDPARKFDDVVDARIRNGPVAAVAAKLPLHRAARTEDVLGGVVVPATFPARWRRTSISASSRRQRARARRS